MNRRVFPRVFQNLSSISSTHSYGNIQVCEVLIYPTEAVSFVNRSSNGFAHSTTGGSYSNTVTVSTNAGLPSFLMNSMARFNAGPT